MLTKKIYQSDEKYYAANSDTHQNLKKQNAVTSVPETV